MIAVLNGAGNFGAPGLLVQGLLSAHHRAPNVEPEIRHCPQGSDSKRKVEDASSRRKKVYMA